jgi:hypothetical protein
VTPAQRLVEMTEAEKYERLRRRKLRLAKLALGDLPTFFAFVMRDEKTQRPVVIPPHQRVLFSFLVHHDKSVLILPVGTGKTTTLAGIGLWMLCRNPNMRGVVVGATQTQAIKVLKIIRAYIETSLELRMVAPDLVPSQNSGDAWSDVSITVKRPPWIKDPSFAAYGIDSRTLMGSRVELMLVDDLLNRENVESELMRKQTHDDFFDKCASRVEPGATASKLVAANTMYHPDDYLNRLAKDSKWPALRASVMGDIWVSNADEDWDCDDLVVLSENEGTEHCRLKVRKPGEVLWPERYPLEVIEQKRRDYIHAPGWFNRQFLSDARDDSMALCKAEWIERCKKNAQALGIYGFLTENRHDEFVAVFTGVDLAVTPEKQGGETVFFTFGIRRDNGLRQILDIESGRWNGRVIFDKLFQKIQQFGSYAIVENNATQQLFIDLAIAAKKSVPVRAFTTTEQGKGHPWQGVIGVFYEMSMGKWLLPCDRAGNVPPEVRKFIDACLYYEPARHTKDVLMACWFGRQQAHEWGLQVTPDGGGAGPTNGAPPPGRVAMLR